jgi:peptide/nickel transport system permease protein
MRRFLLIRFLQALLALWVITIIVFGLSHLTGSPVDALLPDDASPQQIENLIRHWGLDRPYHEQYLAFLGNALQGDFGESLKWRGQSALNVVLQRLPATCSSAGSPS